MKDLKCNTCDHQEKLAMQSPCVFCEHLPKVAQAPPGAVLLDMDERQTAPKNNVQEGKVRLSLLPLDVLEKYLVPAYEEGVIKYERESWRQGFHVSVLIDAALRHITEFYWHGKDVDTDGKTGKHPLAGALFSLLSALHTLDTRPELDDRPGRGGNEARK